MPMSTTKPTTMKNNSRRSIAALCGAMLATLSLAQEPTLVRLRDAVGDTIDAAERDSFRLFPNTTAFHHAVILAIPGPEFFADVTLAGTDSSRQVVFRIMPSQLERIRFLIDNREYMAGQLKSDPNAELTLAHFWKAIEDRPLRSITGEPASLPAAVGPRLPLVTKENRYKCTVHGATCGSAAGGCLGSYTGYTLLEPGHYEQTECGTIYVPALYRVNLPALFATTVGATPLGAVAGYAFGETKDRKPVPDRLAGEGEGWRKGCIGASLVPALSLGFLAAAAAQNTLYGREQYGYNLKNDPNGLSMIPAMLTGLCVTVELMTLAYQVGSAIDRRNAEKTAARLRALGR
jgi:hypothetical protein